MKRGQASIEFLTIFGFVFLMTIPLIIIFFDQTGIIQDGIAENQIKNIATKIADKAEAVYYAGEPSKTTIKAYFPQRIQSITILSKDIVINYTTAKNTIHTIESMSIVNLTGNLSSVQGTHYITLEASGGTVLIRDA
jgi:hypothetical protein